MVKPILYNAFTGKPDATLKSSEGESCDNNDDCPEGGF